VLDKIIKDSLKVKCKFDEEGCRWIGTISEFYEVCRGINALNMFYYYLTRVLGRNKKVSPLHDNWESKSSKNKF